MRAILLFLFASALTGCAKYQYAVVDSHAGKSSDGRIVFETDSIRIVYTFEGPKMPAIVMLYNKLDIPMYVNWQRSSMIVDGKSINRYPETSSFSATAYGTQSMSNYDKQVSWSTTSTSVHELDGSIANPPQMEFIPPKSFIESSSVTINTKFLTIPHGETKRLKKGKRLIFDDRQSPLVFRSYITVSWMPGFERHSVFDHQFWVGEVVNSSVRPSHTRGYSSRKDVSYVGKISRSGVTLLVVVPSIALIALMKGWYDAATYEMP